MEIMLATHIGNVYLYLSLNKKIMRTTFPMTTKNIILFRLRKTGPKIYVVVDIIRPKSIDARFSLEIHCVLASDFSEVEVTEGKA